MRYIVIFLLCSFAAQAQYGRWRSMDQVSEYGYSHLFILGSDTAYVASQRGIYRSTDQGRFWREVHSNSRPGHLSSLVPDPASSSQALILQSNFDLNIQWTAGVFTSGDGGLSWRYGGGAIGNSGGYACAASPNSYYMLCDQDHVVHIDITGNARKFVEGLWDDQFWIRGIAAFDDDRALLYVQSGTVYVTDAGRFPGHPKSWAPSTSGIESEQVIHIYTEGNDAWAGTSTSGVKHTTRPDFRWSDASGGLGTQGALSMHVRRIFRDKRGPLIAMTNDGFYSSADGRNWDFVSNALPDWERPIAAAVDRAGRYYVLYGRDSILVSEDGAQNWTLRMDGLVMDKVRDIAIIADSLFAAGAQCTFQTSFAYDYRTLYWRQIIDGLAEARVAAFVKLSGDTLLAFGVDGSVSLKHSDAPTWQRCSSGLDGGTVTCTAASPNGTVIAGTDSGQLFVSTDRGTIWTRTQPTASAAPIAAVLSVSDSLWFVGSHGEGLYRSEDGGANWSPAGNGMSHPIITALLRRADGDLFAGSFGGGLFRSTDNGGSWFFASAALPASYITSIVGNGINVVAVGSFDKGIHYSSNNGVSWIELNSGLDDMRILRLMLDQERNKLFAIDHGGRLHRNLAGLPTSTNDGRPPADFALHAAYPNPFHDRIELDFELHRPGSIRITLVDMLGRDLALMEEYIANPGRYHRALFTPSVPAGVYLLSLESEDSRQQKIVVRMR